jgi:hypothetical protein
MAVSKNCPNENQKEVYSGECLLPSLIDDFGRTLYE